MSKNNIARNEANPDILEFIKMARTVSNQLQIMSKVELPREQKEITQKATLKLFEKITAYISQGETR